MWHQLAENHLDLLRSSLQTMLSSDARVYRAAASRPFAYFTESRRTSHEGDVSSALEQADKITEGLTLKPHDFSDIKR